MTAPAASRTVETRLCFVCLCLKLLLLKSKSHSVSGLCPTLPTATIEKVTRLAWFLGEGVPVNSVVGTKIGNLPITCFNCHFHCLENMQCLGVKPNHRNKKLVVETHFEKPPPLIRWFFRHIDVDVYCKLS